MQRSKSILVNNNRQLQPKSVFLGNYHLHWFLYGSRRCFPHLFHVPKSVKVATQLISFAMSRNKPVREDSRKFLQLWCIVFRGIMLSETFSTSLGRIARTFQKPGSELWKLWNTTDFPRIFLLRIMIKFPPNQHWIELHSERFCFQRSIYFWTGPCNLNYQSDRPVLFHIFKNVQSFLLKILFMVIAKNAKKAESSNECCMRTEIWETPVS